MLIKGFYKKFGLFYIFILILQAEKNDEQPKNLMFVLELPTLSTMNLLQLSKSFIDLLSLWWKFTVLFGESYRLPLQKFYIKFLGQYLHLILIQMLCFPMEYVGPFAINITAQFRLLYVLFDVKIHSIFGQSAMFSQQSTVNHWYPSCIWAVWTYPDYVSSVYSQPCEQCV